ncbi:MAG: HD domain-containing phosphohydrolase [Gammaproteobacteria bacterium]|nr:HD domain-containing phosphohydrolase [Gammaproteobacteria bacterium]
MEPVKIPADAAVLEDGHYLDHLATVNQSRGVTATEDILNSQGALITRQGARLDHGATQRIAKHKLSKPLEHQIQIEGTITTRILAEKFALLSQQYPDLGALHQKLDFDADFQALLTREPPNPVITQKLTVLHLQQPPLFGQALFGLWLAMLIARELGLPRHEIHMAGMAALIRDLGFLHLPQDVVAKGGSFTADEWRAMQGHVVIGQIIAQDVATLHPHIARAVLEHHEHSDGTGYPAAREGDQLGLFGQIVGMSDRLGAMRLKLFGTSGRNLRDTEPMLLMNSAASNRAVYEAVCALLRKSGLERTSINPLGDLPALLEQLKTRGAKMNSALPILSRLSMVTQTTKPGPAIIKLRRVAAQTQHLMSSSGLVSGEIIAWLEGLQRDTQPAENPFLCEMELLQNELSWHLKRLGHALDVFLALPGEHTHRAEISALAHKLHELLGTH